MAALSELADRLPARGLLLLFYASTASALIAAIGCLTAPLIS